MINSEIYAQLPELVQSLFDGAEFPFLMFEFYKTPKATLRSGTQNEVSRWVML